MKIKIIFFGITTLAIIGIVIVGLYFLTTSEVYECRNLKTNLLFIYRKEQRMHSDIHYEEDKYINMPGVYLWNFECIDGDYGRDSNTIYYLGVSISGADYETFETIEGSNFTKDKNNVYCFGGKVEGADPKTFNVIKKSGDLFEGFGSKGRDKNKSYTCGGMMY